jgi:hypothetical protein
MNNELVRENEITVARSRNAPQFCESEISDDDLNRINAIAPTPLRAEQLHVRSMYLCSTQPCAADGCQFTKNALEQIAELILGQSVMCAHNRNSLPLARFYKAQVVSRRVPEMDEPVYFVRAWFYWMRDTSGAKDLLVNIDGGIYREVSLSWRYNTWFCSVCMAKDSECGHRVGEVVDGQTCFRLIDCVQDVLEGSLVYKAADRETFLAGSRGVDGMEGEPSLMLICDGNDPLLGRLESAGVLCNRHALDMGNAALPERVDHLWLRCDFGDDAERIAVRLLTDEGVCVWEEPLASGFCNAADGNILVIQHSGEATEFGLVDGKEKSHAPARTV